MLLREKEEDWSIKKAMRVNKRIKAMMNPMPLSNREKKEALKRKRVKEKRERYAWV